MPSVLSKVDNVAGNSFFSFMFKGTKSKAISLSVIFIVIYMIKIRTTKTRPVNVKLTAPKDKKKTRGTVDGVFFKRIMHLVKVLFPKWNVRETYDIALLTVFLVLRTFLSIYISSLQGGIVKAIIKADWSLFVKKIGSMAMCAIPASFINSYLDYLNRSLAIHFRKSMTNYFHNKYLDGMTYYQLTNIDARIPNPDQRLTQDIDKWATSLSNLYSNVSKPILDIVLFSKKLSTLLGWQGPLYIILWYVLSTGILRVASPAFGKLTAIEQQLEGQYRSCHTDLVHHSEEIAFYRGQTWEKTRLNASFKDLTSHSRSVALKRLYMGCFDSMLTRYGAVLCGFAILGLPVFGSNREQYLARVGSDASAITRDYIRNSALLINLAKAIGRLVISYKEIQHLAGYTTLVYEMEEVFMDLKKGKYVRVQVNQSKDQANGGILKASLNDMNKGEILESRNIRFEDVPIYTPNGDCLVEKINLEIEPGMNVVVTGPNGCGKSSLFRILGSLWPVMGGKIYRPKIEQMFYIPQRPYLPPGSLRDQVIYPHSKLQMLRGRVSDEDIKAILKDVYLDYIIEREGGLDAVNDWNDVLSGGEKQRIAMARLFYHKPTFAVLDECTSAVSVDVEALLYNRSKELGITLFTVSHRQTLFKFHDYMIRFDGTGGYVFVRLNHNEEQALPLPQSQQNEGQSN
jgi:ATP-binding cassette subfamily D (ALD) protein 3